LMLLGGLAGQAQRLTRLHEDEQKPAKSAEETTD
jgi:hypothetical protein